MNQSIRLLYMFPMVGLHMFYSMLITLMLLNKKIIRKAYLSKHLTFEIWFEWYDLRSLLFKCLGNLFWKFVKLLQSSSLICQKSYQSHVMMYLENYVHICCLACIELCQIVVTLERNFCHALMIKIHVHTTYPLDMLLWGDSIVPSIHSTK